MDLAIHVQILSEIVSISYGANTLEKGMTPTISPQLWVSIVRETRVQSQVESYQKMVLDTSLLNTQHYNVRIKGKVVQSWERSSALPYALV